MRAFSFQASRQKKFVFPGTIYGAWAPALSADEILERCRTSDWWLSAEESLEYGFIDEIR